MKTYYAKPGEVQREWLLVDATGMTLGRLASAVAQILRGKNKPTFTPHVDVGDFVIVVNADKIKVSGTKTEDKMYTYYSGYRGGLRQESFKEAMQKHPERAVEIAVKGMLPHNRLGDKMITKLKVYAGPDHPHAAQNPRKIDLEA